MTDTAAKAAAEIHPDNFWGTPTALRIETEQIIQRLLDERDATIVALTADNAALLNWINHEGLSGRAWAIQQCYYELDKDSEASPEELQETKDEQTEWMKIRMQILAAEHPGKILLVRLADQAEEIKQLRETIRQEEWVANENMQGENQRLEKKLAVRENLIIKHAARAGMDTSQNSWKGCNNWLVGWIDRQLAESINTEKGSG